MYVGAPFAYGALRSYSHYRKACMVTGLVIYALSLVGASFANTTSQLIATQGVLYALGGIISYFPAFLYLDEWFVDRKGLAFGIVIAGGGVAGTVVPLLMQWILHTWGFRTALRTWAVVSSVLTILAISQVKPRIPIRHAERRPQRVTFGFLRSSAFWILQFGNIIQSLGYFMPALYLPCKSFAIWKCLGICVIELTTFSCSFCRRAGLASYHRHNFCLGLERRHCSRCHFCGMAS